MTQSKIPLRSILGVSGLVVTIALLAGCRMVSEENPLEAIEKSIQKITQQAGESVVVIHKRRSKRGGGFNKNHTPLWFGIRL